MTLWRCSTPFVWDNTFTNPKSGSPVTKSRTSARKPSSGSPVLKSAPPPNSRAPLFVVGTNSEEKRAQPPPMLAQGETGAEGRILRRNAGVTKTAEVFTATLVRLLIVGMVVNECPLVGIPTTGTSRCNEINLALANRTASAPSKKRWLLVFIVSVTVGVPVKETLKSFRPAWGSWLFWILRPEMDISGHSSHKNRLLPELDRDCQASAMTSISTATSFGRRATSTVERAGGAFLQTFPYTSFIFPNSDMCFRNTVVFTTFSQLLPAA
jgi:hypothetical protein